MVENGLFRTRLLNRLRGIRFSRQILLLQSGVVLLVLAIGVALVGWLLQSTLTRQYGERALAIAHTVAADPEVIADVTAKRPGGKLEDLVLATTHETGATFVVITDDHSIRLAHPTPDLIGEKVGTSAAEPLAGRDVVGVVQDGSLGLSVRSKTPVQALDGRFVGEVSVGFAVTEPAGDFKRLLWITSGFAVGALLLGVAGSALLNRRLRRVTHGLEPHQLSELLYEREAVLHGIGEGVLAVDAESRISVSNDEAERLLGTPLPLGVRLSEVDLSPRLHKAVEEGQPVDNLLAVAGNRVLVINSRAVRRDGLNIGTVLTFRDRTDLDTLTKELDSIRALSDGLRAQRHEYSNRLHTLSGLLQLGHNGEAVEYLQSLTETSSTTPADVGDTVSDPYLQALLVAKTEQAMEKGMVLTVSDDSYVPAAVTDPIVVNTVLGNLVDNALHAARMGPRRPASVEVTLLAEGTTLHLSVVDSGTGVVANLRENLFDESVSTKLAPGHGLGLALARQAARAHGGEVWLANAGNDESGALFVAALPDMLSENQEGQP
ncbi:MAG: two-component system histidine kinase [Amycolatopsis sp.]|jgi:two-component system CitB family sensor kinase|uniref:sensor histidine kinase n=1 Tax=Amycolatopsis sp. TaxID=37632 RepID=UPI00262A52B6|nr:sensor histidine kinase [Amycolatopsis sp.]MCU1685356.1 two-component system histidine kinase [Amycolatopsis sp.]